MPESRHRRSCRPLPGLSPITRREAEGILRSIRLRKDGPKTALEVVAMASLKRTSNTHLDGLRNKRVRGYATLKTVLLWIN